MKVNIEINQNSFDAVMYSLVHFIGRLIKRLFKLIIVLSLIIVFPVGIIVITVGAYFRHWDRMICKCDHNRSIHIYNGSCKWYDTINYNCECSEFVEAKKK